MPCVTGISSSEEALHFETLLCEACKFLPVEKIKLLVNKNSGICDGIDWYSNHLLEDYMECFNESSEYGHKPCLRMGANTLSVFNSEDYKLRLSFIEKELKRIGFKVIHGDGWYSLEVIEE